MIRNKDEQLVMLYRFHLELVRAECQPVPTVGVSDGDTDPADSPDASMSHLSHHAALHPTAAGSGTSTYAATPRSAVDHASIGRATHATNPPQPQSSGTYASHVNAHLPAQSSPPHSSPAHTPPTPFVNPPPFVSKYSNPPKRSHAHHSHSHSHSHAHARHHSNHHHTNTNNSTNEQHTRTPEASTTEPAASSSAASSSLHSSSSVHVATDDFDTPPSSPITPPTGASVPSPPRSSPLPSVSLGVSCCGRHLPVVYARFAFCVRELIADIEAEERTTSRTRSHVHATHDK